MSDNLMKKRWETAIAGVVMQILLGTVYGWSVFKKPLMETHGWSGAEVGLTFSLVILFLGLAAALGGRFVDRAGARKVASVAALLFGAGTLLAGYADIIGSKWVLWLGYGMIAGIGNGLGYITPIAVLVRWFPDRKGFITGLAVMGFGFGGALMGQLAPLLIPRIGIANIFFIFGGLYLVVLLLAARKMVNPPAGWTPLAAAGRPVVAPAAVSMDFRQAGRMPQFYLLWLILFINITAGIALISNLSPMAQIQTGCGAIIGGTLVLVSSIFNGLGRIFWSTLSDKIGRKAVFLLILGTQVPVLLWLPHICAPVLFGLLACYVLFCYGGGFSTMPSFAADTFGSQNIGSIYGKILLAWGVAGVVGPLLMEYVKETTQSFAAALYIAAGMLVVGFLLTLLYRKPSCGKIG